MRFALALSLALVTAGCATSSRVAAPPQERSDTDAALAAAWIAQIEAQQALTQALIINDVAMLHMAMEAFPPPPPP